VIAYDIENGMDCFESSITAKTLAEAVGVDPTTMERIISGKIAETSFWTLYRISKFLYKGNDSKLISWFYKLDKPENIKAAMEYLAINKQLETLKEIIKKKATGTSSKSLNKWGKFYTLVVEYEENIYNLKEILKKVRRFACGEDRELHLLSKLIEANICYRTVCNSSAYIYEMSNICDDTYEDLQSLKMSFLKISFKLRLNDLKAKRELYLRANTQQARKYAKKNINQEICPLFRANGYYTVGTSFTFESYEDSVSYIEKAIKAYRDADYGNFADDLERSAISLVSAYHGQIVAERDSVEVAHYEAKWGDKKRAIELLNEAIERDGGSMFKTCYFGIANNCEDTIVESLSQFLKIGDNFFAQLPLQHLREHGTPQSIRLAETLYKQFVK
jgi:hypothetical protein